MFTVQTITWNKRRKVTDSPAVSQNDDQSNPEPPSNPLTAQLSSLTRQAKAEHSEDEIVQGNLNLKQAFKKSFNASEQRQNVCSITDNNLPKLMPRPHPRIDETETNVDTGHRVINPKLQLPSVYRMSRDLQNIPAYNDIRDLPSKQGDSTCPLAVEGNKETDIRTKILPSERSQRLHSNSKELPEEFFI
ncbi:hypothetical protein GDO78_001900 [Eleutherodactylus coqui]|uniref:Uncharacterized protein n=1 Tax=Eleutherodactylus coqui TaxID=57060 RepID=A0A8J6KJL0_ELECQ|nr:hypothetical protein GDO78_001900 [Eleutherodactylus coqui]